MRTNTHTHIFMHPHPNALRRGIFFENIMQIFDGDVSTIFFSSVIQAVERIWYYYLFASLSLFLVCSNFIVQRALAICIWIPTEFSINSFRLSVFWLNTYITYYKRRRIRWMRPISPHNGKIIQILWAISHECVHFIQLTQTHWELAENVSHTTIFTHGKNGRENALTASFLFCCGGRSTAFDKLCLFFSLIYWTDEWFSCEVCTSSSSSLDEGAFHTRANDFFFKFHSIHYW